MGGSGGSSGGKGSFMDAFGGKSGGSPMGGSGGSGGSGPSSGEQDLMIDGKCFLHSIYNTDITLHNVNNDHFGTII